MSRPKPKVEAEVINKTNYQCDQVLSAEGIWAVFFNNGPINLKTFNMLTQ